MLQSASLKLEQHFPAYCKIFNNSLTADDEKSENEIEKSKSITNLKAILFDQLMANELDLNQLSKHFNHAIKFSEFGFPDSKMVDVLKFRIVNQAYRFDRIANYLNSGLIKQENFKDALSSTQTMLTLNHQLLICRSNNPYHSSLTRSSTSSKFNSLNSNSLSANFKMINSNWSQSWWRLWYSISTIISLIGATVSVVCAIYFLFTFDYKVGSTILGYMILLGIFLLYIVNLFFIFPYSFVTCWIRCYLMSISYTIILSSMLVKVLNSWRILQLHNYNNLYIQHLNLVNGSNLNNMHHPNGFNNFNNYNNFNNFSNQNLFLSRKLNSLSTMMSMCLGLVSIESEFRLDHFINFVNFVNFINY